MLDLQKLTLRRLFDNSSTDLYSKLTPKYFTGSNLLIYGKIESFYRNNLRIPNAEEFNIVRKEPSLQDYFSSQIMAEDNINDKIKEEFLVAQLQDFCIREETISFLDNFLDELNELEKVEIIDKIQNHLLELNRAIPISDELINIATLNVAPSKDSFVMFPSGLSEEYDNINGGFALQEFIGLGGRRGSGKSILALNATINRFLQGNTVGFFSIEMRYLEIYYRAMSIITEIPFLKFMKNELTFEDKLHAARRKIEVFYENNNLTTELLNELENTKDIDLFDKRMKIEKPLMKENRLFIIDDASLSLNRIDHYCNIFYNKYPNFTMATVDYLNIIATEDSKDWKTQIMMAEALKGLARKYNLTMISPYQVDATLEARYAKGILDSADRAFTFTPKDTNDPNFDTITLYTAKIRNGKNITFDIGMNWECVKVDTNKRTKDISQNTKLLKGTQFGEGTSEENSRDV